MTIERMNLSCDEVDELAGLYVLDALEPAEEDAVRSHLATCGKPHADFAAVGSVVPALLATIQPVEPPAELRAQVLATIAATPQVADATALPRATPAAPPAPVAPAPVAPAPAPVAPVAPAPAGVRPAGPISLPAERERRAARFGRTWQTVVAAAAVLLIVVLGATTFAFQRQAADAEARANTLSAAIAASLDPNSSTASLRGSGVAAAAAGFAAFPPSGGGYLVIRGLPDVPAGKTYEAWFLAGTTPYPSVLLTVGSDGLAVVKDLAMVPGADAMALTVEPAGGSQAPTSTPIVVGKMQAGPAARVMPARLVASSR